jgi:molecular chaperone DnaJ
MDFYKLLDVDKKATEEEIKKAYRKKAMENHPDRNPGDSNADKRFKEVQEAYEVLGDVHKRAQYDSTGSATRASSANPFHGGGWSFFGEGHAPHTVTERGRNIQITLQLDFLEVLNGANKKIPVPQRERCTKCEGQGYTDFKSCNVCHGSGKTALKQSPFNVYISCGACKATGRSGTISCENCKGEGFTLKDNVEIAISIPPGAETGHQIRIGGYGEPSKHPFGNNGDLVLVVSVKEHPIFKRNVANLIFEFPIGFHELCLGTSVEVPTLTGSAMLSIPPRTLDGTQFRLRGLGLPYYQGGKGDLIVLVKLVVPPQINIDSSKKLFDNITKFENEYLGKERERFKQEKL